jgi:hypothetical protein
MCWPYHDDAKAAQPGLNVVGLRSGNVAMLGHSIESHDDRVFRVGYSRDFGPNLFPKELDTRILGHCADSESLI